MSLLVFLSRLVAAGLVIRPWEPGAWVGSRSPEVLAHVLVVSGCGPAGGSSTGADLPGSWLEP
jgi:hypothetical protein